MHVAEAKVAAGIAVGELLVVESEQVQDGGVKVVDVNRLVDGAKAELVRRPVDEAALDAAAGEPHREAVRLGEGLKIRFRVDICMDRACRLALLPTVSG